MERILITGGSGFIGHAFVDYLLKNTDTEIILLERFSHSGNLNRLMELDSLRGTTRVKILWHDLRSPVNEFCANEIGQVDYIVHLAASTHVDRAITAPMEFVFDNVVATGNILEFARLTQKNLKVFLNFSTDEVFGPAKPGTYHKESDAHEPSNPYSATKSGSRQLGYSYFVTYNFPIVTTFTVNNFGERQHPEKLIPKAIRCITRGEPMPLYATVEGDVVTQTGIRIWMYTYNTASAIWHVLKNGVLGEEYNVTGDDEIDIISVCERIAAVVGKPLIRNYVGFYGARPGHDPRYALDSSKLKAIGWTPEYTFDKAIENVVKFTLENPQWS